jgi:23S rRNA (cytidine1920-2'-O)/16S rRNA (cytidine1409-2'-O)-methyltransferase
MVRRGLAADLSDAREAVRAGLVLVSGSRATKAGTLVARDQSLHLSAAGRPFASRAGEKLEAALERFEVDPTDRDCLDAGASTGGFTDCLLRSGAARVVAVDVGYGQLAWGLRTDPRVTVLERTNVRTISPSMLGFRPELVVADLSFISLRSVAPALVGVAVDDASFVLLVKPQFEARPGETPGGVVRDPAVWHRVLEQTAATFDRLGVTPSGVMASPLRGPAGNAEFVLHARRGDRPRPLELQTAIDEAHEVEA